NPEPPAHGPEPSEGRIGQRRRRRHRHRKRRQLAGGPPLEDEGDQAQPALHEAPETKTADETETSEEAEALYEAVAPYAPPAPIQDDRPFLRAVLNDDGEIRYRLRTRQRMGAKYLLREVFD
ncbi:MAG TPA: hypothetical protein VFR10_14225, partial [bacterium]|nr:hypothetical protein [bacterium]